MNQVTIDRITRMLQEIREEERAMKDILRELDDGGCNINKRMKIELTRKSIIKGEEDEKEYLKFDDLALKMLIKNVIKSIKNDHLKQIQEIRSDINQILIEEEMKFNG